MLEPQLHSLHSSHSYSHIGLTVHTSETLKSSFVNTYQPAEDYSQPVSKQKLIVPELVVHASFGSKLVKFYQVIERLGSVRNIPFRLNPASNPDLTFSMIQKKKKNILLTFGNPSL